MISYGQEVDISILNLIEFDFIIASGVSYFKRMYAAKWSTWKYEQTIIKEGNGYRVSGISKINSKFIEVFFRVRFLIMFSEGPKQEVFSYLLTPDNTTVETIDFGILGGDRLTTAEFVDDNTLVSYCKDPATGQVDVIATRTILPNNPNIMYFKTKDVPLDYEMVATMIRQV